MLTVPLSFLTLAFDAANGVSPRSRMHFPKSLGHFRSQPVTEILFCRSLFGTLFDQRDIQFIVSILAKKAKSVNHFVN